MTVQSGSVWEQRAAAITAEMVEAFTVACAKASAVPGATAGDCYRAGLAAAMRARTPPEPQGDPMNETTEREPQSSWPEIEDSWQEWVSGFTNIADHVATGLCRDDLEEAFKDGYSAGHAWATVHVSAAADARLAAGVVNEGQRWQAEIANLRNALKEAGTEMDRRYEMGEAKGRADERANIRAELAEYAEGVAADMGGSSAAFAVLREFASLLEGRTNA